MCMCSENLHDAYVCMCVGKNLNRKIKSDNNTNKKRSSSYTLLDIDHAYVYEVSISAEYPVVHIIQPALSYHIKDMIYQSPNVRN